MPDLNLVHIAHAIEPCIQHTIFTESRRDEGRIMRHG